MSSEHGEEIIHRELETTREAPGSQVAEIVAELEHTDPRDLESVWKCIDNLLEPLFSAPPSPDAQVEITFSYEGYRITVEQDGTAQFVQVDD